MDLTLRDFAHLSISLSALVALMTFLFSQWERYKKEKSEELREWQSVLVFRILDKHGDLTFDEIKGVYLQFVQQNYSINIPAKEIQDDALLRVIIGLLEERKVHYSEDGTYGIDLARPDEREAINKNLVEMMTKKEELNRLIPIIYDTIEKSESKYNSDSLYRVISEKVEFDINYHEYLGSLILMDRQGMIARKGGGILVAMKRVIKDTPNKSMQPTANAAAD